jgi:hypothetical protein
VECNVDKNQIAKENLKHLLTDRDMLLHGSVLSKDDPAINNHYYLYTVFPEVRDNSEFNRWHFIDVGNVVNSPVINPPSKIDFLLLDGGEFTTYFEFFKLFPFCNKYIALDDVDVAKCSKIRSFLKSTGNWEEIKYISERNGFSMFKKIEHPVPNIRTDMKDKRLCIVGACKNSAYALPYVLNKIEAIEQWWKECKVVIYENDSCDDTASKLQEWMRTGRNRILIQESDLNSKYPKRTERLAYIRNILIDMVPKDFDYCLMVDMDNVFSNTLSKDAFESCFNLPFDWDVVTGNSGYYYDIWALNVKELCEFDCVNKVEDDRKMYTHYTKETIDEGCVEQIGKLMTTMRDPMYVENAFNVGAIYKVSAINPCCRFQGLKEDGREICEHRAFQHCMKSHGAKIVFNPQFYL